MTALRTPYIAPALPLVFLALALIAAEAGSADGRRLFGAAIFLTQGLALAVTTLRVAHRLVEPAGSIIDVLAGAAVLFLAIPVGVVTLLGAAGALTLAPVVVGTSLAEIILLAWATRSHPPLGRGSQASSPGWLPLSVAEAFVVSLCLVPYGILALNAVRYANQGADDMTYHLTVVAEWIRNASTAPGDGVVLAHRGYPAAREAMLTWLMLPLRSENLALLFLLEVPMAWLAVHALCRVFEVPRLLACALATAFASTPIVAQNATGQKNDLFLATTFALAAFFLIRVLQTRSPASAGLAGVAAGLAAATKFTGPGYLVLLLLVYAAVAILDIGPPREWRRRLWPLMRLGAITAGIALAISAPWYLRNLGYLDNPLFPTRVSMFGLTLFDGPLTGALIGDTIVGYRVTRLFPYWRTFVDALGGALPVLILTAPAMGLRCLLGRTRRKGMETLWTVGLPGALCLLYLFQPFSLPFRGWDVQPRYLLTPLLLVYPAAGILLATPPAVAGLGAAAATAAAIANVASWTRHWWLAILFAALASLPLAALSRRRPGTRLPLGLMGTALLGILVIAAGTLGVVRLETFREARKPDPDFGYPGKTDGWGHVSLYVRQHISHATILCLGSMTKFPLYGPAFTNRIVTLKQHDLEDLRMRIFGPRAANRYIPEGLDILRLIHDEGIDYVVGFTPIIDNRSQRSDDFVFGVAPTAVLTERYPERFQVVYRNAGSEVLRVIPSSR